MVLINACDILVSSFLAVKCKYTLVGSGLMQIFFTYKIIIKYV